MSRNHNNNILVQHFEALKQQAADEGSKGKIIACSRICKTLKELPPITSVSDVQGIKGIGKKTMDAIAELLLASTPASSTSLVAAKAGKRKKREEEEEEGEEGEETGKGDGGSASLPDLLLAESFDPEKNDVSGWFMSEKLDGVRCYWDGQGRFWSRNQNQFYAPKWFTDALPQGLALDGELFCGRGQFQTTVSIVRSYTPDEARWRTVKYLVFDTPDGGAKPFEERMQVSRKAIGEQNTVAKWVEHVKCRNNDHVEERLAQVVAAGGEGIMLRKPGSHYEGKRSKTLLKVKRAYDAEARVIGHIDGKGRNAGRVGSLRVEMANGKEFSLGSGMTDKDRDNPPKIGSIVTYQFTELTQAGVPRFPRFVRVRNDVTQPHDFE